MPLQHNQVAQRRLTYNTTNNIANNKTIVEGEWLHTNLSEGMTTVYTINLPVFFQTPDHYTMEHCLEDSHTLKERLLQMMRAHWLPFAYFQLLANPGCALPTDTKRQMMRSSIKESILTLQSRVDSLKRLAELTELPETFGASSNSPSEQTKATPIRHQSEVA
jgi:hypothetical protein